MAIACKRQKREALGCLKVHLQVRYPRMGNVAEAYVCKKDAKTVGRIHLAQGVTQVVST